MESRPRGPSSTARGGRVASSSESSVPPVSFGWRCVPRICAKSAFQTVRTPIGAECGVLLWETKNTKAWSNNWIPKLKDDMIEIRASIAILVSVVLPADINRFGQLDGVWRDVLLLERRSPVV